MQSLADRSALSVSYLSEIEKGKKYPKPERLVQLAAALEVPFDELVSLQVADELAELKTAFNSPLLRGFPFELFGLESEDLLALVSGDPEGGSALLRAISEVGRSYDVHVEHFLLAALRSYQQLHINYFDDLEIEAEAFRRGDGFGRPSFDLDSESRDRVRHDRVGVRVDLLHPPSLPGPGDRQLACVGDGAAAGRAANEHEAIRNGVLRDALEKPHKITGGAKSPDGPGQA